MKHIIETKKTSHVAEQQQTFTTTKDSVTHIIQKQTELINNTILMNKLKVCIYDLNHFNFPKSQERIQTQYSPSFLSSVYFTEAEIEFLLAFPSETGQTYGEIIHEFTERKQQSSSDNMICTSHDIAPIMCAVFQIRKNFEKEKAFKKFLNSF
jgi:hypothetical protein